MSNQQTPDINWDHDDPISGAARQATQSAVNGAAGLVQTAYMIQMVRGGRVQDRLKEHAENETITQRPDGTLRPGDRVRAADRGNTGHVVSVDEDLAKVRFTNPETGTEAVVRLPTDQLQLLQPTPSSGIFHPNPPPPQPDHQPPQPDNTAATQPGKPQQPAPKPDRPIQADDWVKAGDRGNVGLVLTIDKETAQVRFTNTQTGATKDVPLPTTSLERIEPRNPTTGKLRPGNRPDPRRIQQTKTSTNTRPKSGGRPAAKPKPKRPPKPRT